MNEKSVRPKVLGAKPKQACKKEGLVCGGGAANKNDRKFFGFAPRELVERGRGASVIHQNPADFVQNTFELCIIHTATQVSGLIYSHSLRCGQGGFPVSFRLAHPSRASYSDLLPSC